MGLRLVLVLGLGLLGVGVTRVGVTRGLGLVSRSGPPRSRKRGRRASSSWLVLGSGLGLRLGLGLGLGLTLVSPVIACLVEVYGAELGLGLFRVGVRSWGPSRRSRA